MSEESNKTITEVSKIAEELITLTERVQKAVSTYNQNKDTVSIDTFESCKHDLISILDPLSSNYATMKYYHNMYGHARKTKKSEVIEDLIDKGMNVTRATAIVYSQKEFTSFMTTLRLVEKIFQRTASLYFLCTLTLDNLRQSISVSRKVTEQ